MLVIFSCFILVTALLPYWLLLCSKLVQLYMNQLYNKFIAFLMPAKIFEISCWRNKFTINFTLYKKVDLTKRNFERVLNTPLYPVTIEHIPDFHTESLQQQSLKMAQSIHSVWPTVLSRPWSQSIRLCVISTTCKFYLVYFSYMEKIVQYFHVV